MHADPDVTAWLACGPMSIDEAGDVIARFDAHVDAHGFGPWAVERRADALLVGVCGLSHEARARFRPSRVAGRARTATARRLRRPLRQPCRCVTAHACQPISATYRSAKRSGNRRHPRRSGRKFPNTD
ncbi:hypothetical protein [Burkholderia cenocepacia]|uniref:GNAT family N-acetyltransferase n=1 Tax=Burkholderia cenocepacia TaxID=95486 RepID=UPI002AB68058|nr:hypothetical protein [Burkholderia cenocepacia]